MFYLANLHNHCIYIYIFQSPLSLLGRREGEREGEGGRENDVGDDDDGKTAAADHQPELLGTSIHKQEKCIQIITLDANYH